MRLSSLKYERTSFTYASRYCHFNGLLWTEIVGLLTHPLLWIPGLGSGCLPGDASAFQQSSKTVNNIFILITSSGYFFNLHIFAYISRFTIIIQLFFKYFAKYCIYSLKFLIIDYIIYIM